MLTCFVIIGYGEKVDPVTHKKINLDRVYENIIKPVFDDFNNPQFECFRACDKIVSGVIDTQMYKWIYEADFVVADISTLNPNAIYELGIRHALKPYSTIIIAEDELREFPFDINHVKIERYKHLGDDIGVSEARRIIKELSDRVRKMLDEKSCDSPVYTFIKDLEPPVKQNKTRTEEQPAEKIEKNKKNRLTLAELIKSGEKAQKRGQYGAAVEFFQQANHIDESNTYLKRMILQNLFRFECQEKSAQLRQSIDFLESSFNLNESPDIEILRLACEVYREKLERCLENEDYFEMDRYSNNSVASHEKVYFMVRNALTAGACAYCYVLKAVWEEDLDDTVVAYYKAKKLWRETVKLCDNELGEIKKDTSYYKKKKLLLYILKLKALLFFSEGEKNTEYHKLYKEASNIIPLGGNSEFIESSLRLSGYVKQIISKLRPYTIIGTYPW